MTDGNSQSKGSTELSDVDLFKVDLTSKEISSQTIITSEPKLEHPVIQVPTKMSLNQHHSSHAISSKKDVIVYIPDIPSNLSWNDMEQLIQTRLWTILRIKVNDVKCYLKLGVAAIRTTNEDDKNKLVSKVQSMVLDPKRGTIISFVNEIELDTFIVLEQTMSRIPSADEVARHYAQAYKTSKTPACESISVPFPNIFRIFVNTLDELVKAANTPDFRINSAFAVVYPRADCSFFEDLPPYTNDEKVTSAIAAQIGESHLASTYFYVQCNKQTSNAVVLASKSAKKWVMEGHLTIDGRNFSKKVKLTYRVLVSPVPRGFDVNDIVRHFLFAGRVVSYKHIDESLIVELDDLDHYSNCIEKGALCIKDTVMNIDAHAVVNDPYAGEIDAVNWYETAMLDIKPDIMTIINNYQHPIFRYKWNAENWIQQMKKAETTDRCSKGYDLIRHLLRVTVMLNTIATLRKKKYAVDDKEIILKLKCMRTIRYDHKAKLLYGKKIHQTEMKIPYPSTTVKVINEDCLVLYEKLVFEGRRPLLLNMANATNPGGGYRKGDCAQEENLFRRSDYYHSLDLEIADEDRSERFYCTSKCEVKPLKGFSSFYPMDEFGAVYTSGITVFRQTEVNGYAYMKNPLYNVSAIAMAAYQDPRLNNKNMLENKLAINTHRKIENIFAIAHQHKHDCLVLSALGCGTLRNPPIHIALLFKSVIYQYAGYFDSIYFAIIDDHNTGNQINPHGNFLPFQQILDGLVVKPPKTLRVNGVSGPHRILSKTPNGQLTLSDACISHLPPCQHGTVCRDLKDADHNRQFSHPPMCSLQDVTSPCDQMDDEVHMFTFMHIMKCKHGGECTNNDLTHSSDYDHLDAEPMLESYPSFDMSFTTDTGTLLNRYHKYPIECVAPISDPSMWSSITTTFSALPPCPDSVYCLQQDLSYHTRRYSHPCRFNELCRNKINESHLVHERHNVPMCPEDKYCPRKDDPVHRAKYRHTNLPDYLIPCRYQNKCYDKSVNHRIKYFHGEALPSIEKSKQTTYDYSGGFDESDSD